MPPRDVTGVLYLVSVQARFNTGASLCPPCLSRFTTSIPAPFAASELRVWRDARTARCDHGGMRLPPHVPFFPVRFQNWVLLDKPFWAAGAEEVEGADVPPDIIVWSCCNLSAPQLNSLLTVATCITLTLSYGVFAKSRVTSTTAYRSVQGREWGCAYVLCAISMRICPTLLSLPLSCLCAQLYALSC